MNRSSGYGTAFEKLEDEDGPIKKRPKRVHEEVVTDERGRRRFHGAFTGGFSAGYFNSVGSKHGWVPQTFKSSRNKRAEVGEARPEDFMDEEDLGEFGIASRRFHVNRQYIDGGETGQAVWDRPSTSVSRVAEIEEDDGVRIGGKRDGASIGYQIMKKMGYREGKGVGAPLTRRQLEMQRLHEARAHGKKSRFDKTAVEEAEMFAAGFEFVPEDIPPVYFACKTDTHGLGYSGLSGLKGGYGSIPIEGPSSSKSKKKGHGDAFGVGVFEDSDDDIYGADDMGMYNFAIEGNRNADVDPMAVVLAGGGGGNIDIKFSAAKSFRKKTPHLSIKVPAGFNPNYTPVAFDASALPAAIKNYGSNMTPLQRAMILGDKAPSVMELLSDADRERLRHARRLADENKPTNVVKQEVEVDEFPDDEEKSYRFKKYLQCLRRGVEMGLPPGVSYSQWQAEEEEFQNRVPTELRYLLPDVKERKQPLFKGDFSANLMDQLKSKFVSQDDARQTAAKPKPLEPFKKLEWHPATRLCKRLKVPDPFPESDFEGVIGSRAKNKTSQGFYEFTKTAMEKELLQKNAIANAVGGTHREPKQEPVDDPLTEDDPLIQFFDLMDKVYGTTTEEIKEGERLEKEYAKPAEPAPMPKQLSPPRPAETEPPPKKKKTIFDNIEEEEKMEYGPAIPTNFIPPSKVKNPDLPADFRPKFESKVIKKEPRIIELLDTTESDSSSDESRHSKKKKSKKSKKDKHKKKDRKERSSSKKSKHKHRHSSRDKDSKHDRDKDSKHSRDRDSKSSKKSKKHRRHRSSSRSD
uniref:G-patch domain-containing protein n=1 Tax=Panagrellus redivivus TaxID=6233 RepID=A0A7E4W411_PANRE